MTNLYSGLMGLGSRGLGSRGLGSQELGFGLRLTGLALLACAAGCQQQDIQEIPNRVLDRPTDATLICVEVVCGEGEDVVDTDTAEGGGEATTDCRVEPRALSQCAGEIGGCGVRDPRLIGFVANSERNEIAMFTKCDNRLVDMSPSVPGYNFIPAGTLPTELDADDEGCRVVSTNVGSCDLNVLDGPALAGFALELPEEDLEPELSSLVSTLVPERFDVVTGQWVRLGARPGNLVTAPSSLTTAPGLGQDVVFEGFCDPRERDSAYVTFPTCNLVAEIDLQTGRVLQSRRFESDGEGGVTVIDTGISPSCPVECPTQFADGLPTDLPVIDAEGPFPQSIELLAPDPDNPDDGQSLFVGGLGSDILFEIPIDDAGEWGLETLQLELAEEAGGIKNIRISPRIDLPDDEGLYRFIYVVAGDGSTRVIGRELEELENQIGIECETQPEPSTIASGLPSFCTPVSQSPNTGQPSDRRSRVRGPGIRAIRGEEVTDWMFVQTEIEGSEDDVEDVGNHLIGSPFEESSTTAIGVTNGGFGVYVGIDQTRVRGGTTPDLLLPEAVSDTGVERSIMDVRLFSHSLWPNRSRDTGGAVVGAAELPLVVNEAPPRVVPSGQDPVRVLAPTLRRLDAFYVESEQASRAYGVDEELDNMRALYDEDVARIVAHDYRAWGSAGGARWSMEWEASIPGTRGSTGRIKCDNPNSSWGDATCLSTEAGDVSLLDSGADFCDDGVLPGDKLVLLSCRSDFDCGDGRRCLQESANTSVTGICVAESAYEEQLSALRAYCGDFISDPCGEPIREYTITRAFQDELWIQARDRAYRAYLRTADEERCAPNMAYNGQVRVPELDPDTEELFTVENDCVCLAGFSEEACGGEGEGCCPIPGALLNGQAPIVELEDRFFCPVPSDEDLSAGYTDDGTCTADTDCVGADGEQLGMCIDSRCRQRCQPTLVDVPQVVRDEQGNPVLDPNTNEPMIELVSVPGDDCREVPLPGPTCFGEFVDYQVGLRDAFLVSGPGLPRFVTDLVELAEVTDMDDPAVGKLECVPTQNGDISRLLTSRLPIPRSDDPDDLEWANIPVCEGEITDPGELNPCRIAGTARSELYHLFEYEQRETVSALRFTNPIFSIVVDLTALESLADEVPNFDDTVWPYDATRFRRSRIPRGYRQEFGLNAGYLAFGEALIFPNNTFPATYPVRIIPAPQQNVAFVVDSAGPGSSNGIRGQVMRVEFGPSILVTQAFDGVR